MQEEILAKDDNDEKHIEVTETKSETNVEIALI